jgi:hypothetical protein
MKDGPMWTLKPAGNFDGKLGELAGLVFQGFDPYNQNNHHPNDPIVPHEGGGFIGYFDWELAEELAGRLNFVTPPTFSSNGTELRWWAMPTDEDHSADFTKSAANGEFLLVEEDGTTKGYLLNNPHCNYLILALLNAGEPIQTPTC